MSDSNRPSVAVLMSTYNGEKYLREQVDSILCQRDVDVHLYIRDDSSTDTTLDIICGYIDANPGKISLTAGKNLGVGRSFMELVYNIPDTYDYYAFSDQDDVWLQDKLSAGIRFLKKRHKEVYAGELMRVDAALNQIGLTNKNVVDTSPYGIMARNRIYGCTMIFSNRFHALLRDRQYCPDESVLKLRNHDCWAAMVAAVFDMITYDMDYHILYRQHSNNVVGFRTCDSAWELIRVRIRSAARQLLDQSKRNVMSKISREILRLFPEEAARFPYLRTYAEAEKLKNRIKLTASYAEYRKHGTKEFAVFLFYVWLHWI